MAKEIIPGITHEHLDGLEAMQEFERGEKRRTQLARKAKSLRKAGKGGLAKKLVGKKSKILNRGFRGFGRAGALLGGAVGSAVTLTPAILNLAHKGQSMVVGKTLAREGAKQIELKRKIRAKQAQVKRIQRRKRNG